MAKINIELNNAEYKLLIEVIESYVATCEAGMVDGIFYTKSDKVYNLVNKLKAI